MVAPVVTIVGREPMGAACQEAQDKGRIPRTAGTDQLSLNLSVTRSPGSLGSASILLWRLGGLDGRMTAGGFFLLTGCLEAASGMAQCGGMPWLPWVASVREAASKQRLQAHLWVVPQVCF